MQLLLLQLRLMRLCLLLLSRRFGHGVFARRLFMSMTRIHMTSMRVHRVADVLGAMMLLMLHPPLSIHGHLHAPLAVVVMMHFMGRLGNAERRRVALTVAVVIGTSLVRMVGMVL